MYLHDGSAFLLERLDGVGLGRTESRARPDENVSGVTRMDACLSQETANETSRPDDEEPTLVAVDLAGMSHFCSELLVRFLVFWFDGGSRTKGLPPFPRRKRE